MVATGDLQEQDKHSCFYFGGSRITKNIQTAEKNKPCNHQVFPHRVEAASFKAIYREISLFQKKYAQLFVLLFNALKIIDPSNSIKIRIFLV